MTGHRPWRELFEKLPPEDQVEIKANTAKVLEERRKAIAQDAPGRRVRGSADEGRPAVRPRGGEEARS